MSSPFNLISLLLLLPLLSLSGRTSSPSMTLSRVPADSILVLSLDAENLIANSGLLQNPKWHPLFNRLEQQGLSFQRWISDSNDSGIAWEEPIQFFVRLIAGERPLPQFGAILKVRTPHKADERIAELGKFLGLRASKRNPTVYQRTTQPFAIGREGTFCFLLGTLLSPHDRPLENDYLETFVSSLSESIEPRAMTVSLGSHAQFSSDISVYFEGTGIGRLLEQMQTNTLLSSLLPVFDPLFEHSLGIFMDSRPGSLLVKVRSYSNEEQAVKRSVFPLRMVDLLPGDAPLVARLSLPESEFHQLLGNGVDSILKVFSGNQLNADTDLPGFDLSPRELLQFPSGDFVFAGADFRFRRNELPDGRLVDLALPFWALGLKTSNTLAYKELASGLNSGLGMSSLLDLHEVRLLEKPNSIWVSGGDYTREIDLERPIEPLSFRRKKLLNNHLFALDFNPKSTARSLRKSSNLSFSRLKRISWLDACENLSMRLNAQGEIECELKLTDPRLHGWRALFDGLAQELIDRINDRLFLAIAGDDLEGLSEAVALGALINANDRFGHSPMHYAAYKGNPFVVDYLLRNGGDPNARGNHCSTPLHSAAWGRHPQVVELLLEDGAEVDALTDEKETPLMTATLRGQTEIAETLLALSADPHAVDAYGSNLMDLAAASGNKEMARLYENREVKSNNPLHLAAGLGDFESVQSLLDSGIPVNLQDSFGATPLLVATVAGREDMVDFLLDRSADPTIEAKDGYSLLHGAAFSGKKSLIRKMLSYGLKINQRFGPDAITPTDVGEEGSEGLIYLRSMGGRSAWELGPQ